jgi:hypothetical protein
MQNVSSEMLRDLFKFRETRSLIADSLKLESVSAKQNGFPSSSDLDQWGHHADLRYYMLVCNFAYYLNHIITGRQICS